jgi:hypothetical protein
MRVVGTAPWFIGVPFRATCEEASGGTEALKWQVARGRSGPWERARVVRFGAPTGRPS